MSQAILNLITKDTKKEDVLKAYEEYQDTQETGFVPEQYSRVEPILCEIPEGSRVLDIGCNSGEFIRTLRDGKNCDTVGVDVANNVLEAAKKRNLNVVKADAENLPFPDASFDVVTCMETLAHLHDPAKALKEIRRVLKPSGFFLGSTPHKNLLMSWEESKPHHEYFDEETLTDLLSEDFEVAHFKVLNGAQFSVGMASSLMADKPAEILWKCGGKGTTVWEYDLINDNKTLRVFMGPTQPPGSAYYRMICSADKMRKLPETEIGYESFAYDRHEAPGEWQTRLIRNEEGRPVSTIAMDHFEKLLKVANPWVFQLIMFDDVIAALEAAKDMYPSKKLITEMDDWLFDVPAYNIASHPYKPGSPKEKNAYEQLQLSDAVVVSTSFLKEKVEALFPGKPVYLIPNAIDFSFWDSAKRDEKSKKKPEGIIRIGYTGCGNHSGDLEIVKPVLLALLDEFPNLEVYMAQTFDCFSDVKHERFKNINVWAPIPMYPSMLKGWDLDIGIAPLRDNNFNRAKSNLRWLEYSALGIPSVCSSVRPFSESIKDGEDGFLATNKNVWYEKLKALIVDKTRRFNIGNAAYSRVKKNFNADDTAKLYRDVLAKVKNS